MKKEELFEAIGDIDEKYITEASRKDKKNRLPSWSKWIAVAASFCLIIGEMLFGMNRTKNHKIQSWDSSFTPKQYFRYCKGDENPDSFTNGSDCVTPYADSRYFTSKRTFYEENEVIPVIKTHPMFSLIARYNKDGSLYRVEISWNQRDLNGRGRYSDLTVIAGTDEVFQTMDCDLYHVNPDGTIDDDVVTVTERDEIQIVARGSEKQKKTISFMNSSGYYQISGSWNDSYEDVVGLLEWFWEHPIDFTRFTMDAGDRYTYTNLCEMPEAFESDLPDFEKYGFLCEDSSVTLKNDVPLSMEAHYISNVTKDQAMNGEYTLGENGCTKIHWCIDTEPNYYEEEECIGTLENLTKEQVLKLMPPDEITTETKIQFKQGDYVVTIYASDLEQAWNLIESIQPLKCY